MKPQLRKFATDQDGAVTVDWVTLTAAIVLLATSVGWSIHATTVDTGEVIGDKMLTTSANLASN